MSKKNGTNILGKLLRNQSNKTLITKKAPNI